MANHTVERHGSDSDVSSYAQKFVPCAQQCVAEDVDRHSTEEAHGTPSYTCIDLQGL